MAIPKVFVSSTCFDLAEVREQLSRFIRSFGFDPILSEHGDIFYKPDCHTHDSCLHEVSNCNLFILIIGGRFGGEYVSDKTKSITNAEYAAARTVGMPIFTYVREGVLADHRLYQKNKGQDFAGKIIYPSIDDQKHSADIFKFIDEVRKRPANNALEGFQTFSDIESHLRKQWAGLVFDLLRTRHLSAQIGATNNLISGLTVTSQKLEDLVKSLYLSSDKDSAEKEIASIEAASKLEVFFENVLRPNWIKDGEYLLDPTKIHIDRVAQVNPDGHTWWSYLVETGLFDESTVPHDPENLDSDWDDALRCLVTVEDNRYFLIMPDENPHTPNLFEGNIIGSTFEQRKKALLRVLEKFSIGGLLESRKSQKQILN